MGELESTFARDLERDPAVFAAVVIAILQANFPETLHEDILDEVGISLDGLSVRPVGPRARRRDPAFRELVLVAYEYRCAVCGYDGQLLREAVGIDAAHVRWWAAGGPDELANGLALCSLHHKLLDRGAIGLGPDHTVAVSSHFIGRSPTAENLVLSLIGRELLKPQTGQLPPHVSNIDWHRTEVFRGPARESG